MFKFDLNVLNELLKVDCILVLVEINVELEKLDVEGCVVWVLDNLFGEYVFFFSFGIQAVVSLYLVN